MGCSDWGAGNGHSRKMYYNIANELNYTLAACHTSFFNKLAV